MKKKIIFLFIILCLGFLKVYTDEYDNLFDDLTSDSAEETDSTDSKKKFDIKNLGFTLSLIGDHTFEFNVPCMPDHIDFEGYIKSPKFSNDIGIEIYFKNLRLISHWKFDLILNQWDDWRKLLEIIPQENYIAWNPWKLTFIVGFQNYNWGTADLFNPTDNLNIRDLRRPIDPTKISIFSIYGRIFPIKFLSFEMVYVPFYLNLLNDPETIQEEYGDIDIEINDATFKPEFFGLAAKLNFFTRFIDFSFSYTTVIDPYFTVDADVEKVTKSGQYYYGLDNLDLYNTRLHHFGTDFKAVVNIFSIWLEVCYTMTEDYLMNLYNIRNHKLYWATGFDFNYGPDSSFYCNIQYLGYFIPFFDKDFYSDYDEGDIKFDDVYLELNKDKEYYEEFYVRSQLYSVAGLREGLIQGVSVNMNWPVLNNKLTPSIQVIYFLPLLYDMNYSIRYGSLYVRPELDIMPFETFNILVGAQFFLSWYKKDGVVDVYQDDFIGSNYGSSSVYLLVKYKWGIDVKR